MKIITIFVSRGNDVVYQLARRATAPMISPLVFFCHDRVKHREFQESTFSLIFNRQTRTLNINEALLFIETIMHFQVDLECWTLVQQYILIHNYQD